MFTYAVASDPSVAGYAMVSDRFLAVLGADAGDAVATSLWRTLGSADVTLESVLEALAQDAPDAVSDVALIELVDVRSTSVDVAVRGQARIELDGTRDDPAAGRSAAPAPTAHVGTGAGSSAAGSVDGRPGARRWSRSGAHDVTGMTLRLSGAGPSGGRLPLARGIVRSDRLDWGPLTPAATSPEAAASDPDPSLSTVRREDLPSMPPAIEDGTELGTAHRRGAQRASLRIGTDRPLDLSLPLVLGRSPHPARHPGARLVTVPSPLREISSSHLELRLDGDTLLARDLDSTNGTIVRTPDGAAMLLRQGAQVRLAAGSSLDLGDGVAAVFELDADGPAPELRRRRDGRG